MQERFEVHESEEISSGASSNVFRGYDSENETDIAIKRMNDKTAAHEEYTIMNSIGSHQNLITPYGYFEDANYGYIAMELFNGSHLGNHLKGEKRDQSYVRSVLHNTLDGISHVHGQNYFHMDISPRNLLIDREGNLKVIDFGLSKKIKDGKIKGTRFRGTWEYTSPEQTASIMGSEEVIDASSDLYALAAVGFYLLNGKPPVAPDPEKFKSATDYLSECLHLKDRVPYLPSNSSLEEVLLKQMSNGSKDRYESIDSFRTAILETS